MKAIIYERYGAPDVLQFKEIDKPVPKENEILVEVYSTTVTAGDWRMRKADPFAARIFSGLLKPTRIKILGFELSGVVEEVGAKVSNFKKGDEVFAFCGFKFGAYAEYKCLPNNELIALKPANISFDEAAAVPVGALTALRLLKRTNIQPGHDVLIYGASGSVGTYAVQIAKHYGAQVTAVCSTGNIEMVRAIGADHVIDYTKEEFSNTNKRFDVVFDAVGKVSKSACKKLGKRFVSVSGSPKANPDDMQTLKELLEQGKLKPVIDRIYDWEQIQEAHAYVQQFHKKGNVVIQVKRRS